MRQAVLTDDQGSTAVPTKIVDYHFKLVAATAGDTVDLNAVVDNNINAVIGMLYGSTSGTIWSGTSVVSNSGTSLIVGVTGSHELGIRVALK